MSRGTRAAGWGEGGREAAVKEEKKWKRTGLKMRESGGGEDKEAGQEREAAAKVVGMGGKVGMPEKGARRLDWPEKVGSWWGLDIGKLPPSQSQFRGLSHGPGEDCIPRVGSSSPLRLIPYPHRGKPRGGRKSGGRVGSSPLLIQTRGPLQPGTARLGRRNNPSTGHRQRAGRQQGRFRWLLLVV